MAVTDTPKPGTSAGTTGTGSSGPSLADAIKALSTKTKNFWVTNPKHGDRAPATGMIAYWWIKAGGNPKYAPQAVAAALAESGGSPAEVSPPNKDGSKDVGLWQINSTHGPQLATTDPIGNARAAIQLSHNGTDWSAWCTSYDDGVCHGGMNSPHYAGAGLGNYQSGVPVLPAFAVGYLYAKDAVAGAIYGAQNVAGLATDLTLPWDPVTQVGAGAVDTNQAAFQADVNKDTGGAWGGGTVGTILAYAGYGLLAAFGAALLLLALAILVLALVEKQGALAAVPGVGRIAGAASEVRAGVNARGARNQASGADAARKSRPVRRLHGETGRAPAKPTPTHGGGARRARRVHDAGTNPPSLRHRIRHAKPITREQAGSPF